MELVRDELSFEYLAIATGITQTLPTKVTNTEKIRRVAELRRVQERIETNRSIAVLGGLEADIDQDLLSRERRTLVLSREELLNNLGKRLHELVMQNLQIMNMRFARETIRHRKNRTGENSRYSGVEEQGILISRFGFFRPQCSWSWQEAHSYHARQIRTKRKMQKGKDTC